MIDKTAPSEIKRRFHPSSSNQPRTRPYSGNRHSSTIRMTQLADSGAVSKMQSFASHPSSMESEIQESGSFQTGNNSNRKMKGTPSSVQPQGRAPPAGRHILHPYPPTSRATPGVLVELNQNLTSSNRDSNKPNSNLGFTTDRMVIEAPSTRAPPSPNFLQPQGRAPSAATGHRSFYPSPAAVAQPSPSALLRTPFPPPSSTPRSTGRGGVETINSRPNNENVIAAVAYGRGFSRAEVGMAVINITSCELHLCHMSDNPNDYVKTMAQMNLFQPTEVLMLDTTLTATASGTATLAEFIKRSNPDLVLTSVGRKLFNEANGIQLIEKLAVSDDLYIALIVQQKYYALSAASALMFHLENNLNFTFAPKTLRIFYRGPDEPALQAEVGQSCATILSPVIRFPVNTELLGEKTSSDPISQCLWFNCSTELGAGQSLLEHIQSAHVSPQFQAASHCPTLPEPSRIEQLYACQWEGCKMKGKMSSSWKFLESHVLLHAGFEPFHCIMMACKQRFKSKFLLERHVKAHLKEAPAKRNFQKLRKQSCSIATSSRKFCDFFDNGIMERLQHRLLSSSHVNENGSVFPVSNGEVTLTSQVIGKRFDEHGCLTFLLRWTPPELLPDEWVTEDEVVDSKSAPVNR